MDVLTDNDVTPLRCAHPRCRPTAGRRLAFTALFDNITWGVEQSADLAEEQVRLLGSHLGFVSARPEKEDRDGGPDNLWDLSAKLNAVIELKTEISRPDPVIIKSEAGQLGHSIVWDQERNPHVETHVPVLLHPSARLAVDAHLPDGARVITAEQLDHLNRDVLAFASDLAAATAWSGPAAVAGALQRHRLTAEQIIPRHSIAPTKARRRV